LVTCRDEVFSLWPPLYPLVMAAIEALGLELFSSLRVLHLLALASTLALAARLVFVLCGSRWAVIAAVGSLALSSRVHEFTIQILSETFFAPLVLGALLAGLAFFETRNPRCFLLLVALSALACLQRYVGVSLVVAMALALAWSEHGSLLARMRCAALYAAASLVPLVLWLARNYALEGAFTGGRNEAEEVPSSVFRDALTTLARWAVPDDAPLWTAVPVFVAGMVMLALAFRDLARRAAFAWTALCTSVYLAFVVGLAAAVQIDRIADRLLFPALPLLVVLGWSALFRAARTKVALGACAILVAGAWAAGASRLASHRERWRTDGAGTIHTRLWQEHPVTRALRSATISGPCWSNAPELVWLIHRVPVRFVRSGPKAWERVGEQAAQSGGSLAWFQQDGRPKAFLPELERHVSTAPLADPGEGLLLRLEPRAQR